MNSQRSKPHERCANESRSISFYALAIACLAFLALFVTLPSAPEVDCRIGSDTAVHVVKHGRTGETPTEGIGEIPAISQVSWIQTPPIELVFFNKEEVVFPCTTCFLKIVRFRPPPVL